MKIAVVTDDGKTISSHFGRARNCLVYDIQDKKVQRIETRPKAGRHIESISHHDDSLSHDLHKFYARHFMKTGEGDKKSDV